MIKNLQKRLTTVGRIKIGVKGKMIESKNGAEFQPPKKLDHMIVTTAMRDEDNNFIPDMALMETLKKNGGLVNKDGNLVGVPFRLLYDGIDQNFKTRLASFKGGKCVCYGDNETAFDMMGKFEKPKPCPCERFTDPDYTGKDKCKMNGSLTIMIDQTHFFGQSYIFKTTSKNTIIGMLSSLEMFSQQLGGKLRGIPLMLKMDPIETMTPQNIKTTIHVVSICFNGTMPQMFQEVLKLTNDHKQFQIDLDENQTGLTLDPEEERDLAEEFYPDTVDVKPVDTVKKQEETEVKVQVTKEIVGEEIQEDILPETEEELSVEDKIKAEKKRKSDEENKVLLERLNGEPDAEKAVALMKRIRKDLLIDWLKKHYTTIPGHKGETAFSLPTATMKIWWTLGSNLIREFGNLAYSNTHGETIKNVAGGVIKEKDPFTVSGSKERSDKKKEFSDIPEMAPILGFTEQKALVEHMRSKFKDLKKPINGTASIPSLWDLAAKLLDELKTVANDSGIYDKDGMIKNGSDGKTITVKPDSKEDLKPDPETVFLWDDGPVLDPNSMETKKIFTEMKTGKDLHGYDGSQWAEIVARYKDKDGNPLTSARFMTYKQAEHLIANIDIPF